MASIASNLKISTIKIVNGVPTTELLDVKKVLIKLHSDHDYSEIKELFYNGELIWKNSSSFVFVQNLTEEKLQEILSEYGEDTLIFEGFNNGQDFYGEYLSVEPETTEEEIEKMNLDEGQLVVKMETTEGENE